MGNMMLQNSMRGLADSLRRTQASLPGLSRTATRIQNGIAQRKQAAQPTYATATDYTGTAANMLPTPTPVAGLRNRAGYEGAYNKTTVDPNELNTRWNVASNEINDAYMKKGGFYDRMVGDLNERGLATSGERNAQTATMGNDLAKALATARQNLEADRMNTQAGYDENYANRLSGLLNNEASIDQNNANMAWTGATGRASLASQLADARNSLINQNYQNQTARTQAESQDYNSMLQYLTNIGNSTDLENGQEDALNALLGFPTPKDPNEDENRKKLEAVGLYVNPATQSRWINYNDPTRMWGAQRR